MDVRAVEIDIAFPSVSPYYLRYPRSSPFLASGSRNGSMSMINDVTLVSPAWEYIIGPTGRGAKAADLAPRKEAVVFEQKLDKAREKSGKELKIALRHCEWSL